MRSLSAIGRLELVSSCAGLVVISLSRRVGLIARCAWRGGAAKHRILDALELAAKALIDCDLSLTTAGMLRPGGEVSPTQHGQHCAGRASRTTRLEGERPRRARLSASSRRQRSRLRTALRGGRVAADLRRCAPELSFHRPCLAWPPCWRSVAEVIDAGQARNQSQKSLVRP